MNGMNNSTDESVDCPLCMEPLEVDDLNFYPCTCGYQICRFCWHRIRTDENELCPACRKAYPENPADFKPLTQEQITAFKAEKRQRDQQRKQKITENRKHLANVRVVQKNLVFVVGLPPRLADADILKKHDYFGKYGKIHKVVINPSTTYAGVQGPSASAYVTYVHNNDALRAIQNVNNITIDGRQIKTSLGTTKYCSHFMKNQQCPKGDCMYLHELGDQEASFTKEEMHQCKHQEYEKRLHDALIASSASQNSTAAPLLPMHGSTGTPSATEFKVGGVSEVAPTPTTTRVESSAPIKISNKNNGDNKLVNGNSSNSGSSGSSQEAWPSLSVSPVNSKDGVNGVMPPSSTSKKGNKDGAKEKGSKKDKKNKKQSNHNKENQKDSSATTSATTNGSTTAPSSKSVDKHNTVHEKESSGGGVHSNSKQNRKRNNSSKSNISPDDEVQFIEYIEKECNGSEDSDNGNGKNTDTRSLSSSSSNNSDSTSSLSESTSGKSSPGNEFPDHTPATSSKGVCLEQKTVVTSVDKKNISTESALNLLNSASTTVPHPEQTSVNNKQIPNSNLIDSTAAGLSNLNLFDCNNSFLVQSFHPMLKKLEAERGQQLPDLINGIDSYQNHMNNSSGNNVNGLGPLNGINNLNNLVNLQNQLNYNQSEDWEQVLKMAMMRNNVANKQLEERNNLLNMMGSNGLGGGKPHGLLDFNNSQNYNGAMDPSSLFPMQRELQQHSQQLQNGFGPNDNLLSSDLFGPNMSKFFDFHKNQQQQQQAQQQNFMVNGHNLMNQRDHHMGNMMDARVNRQFLEQQQMNQLGNKFDSLPPHHMLAQQQQQTQQKPPNRMPVFPQMSSNADDDLGFDPFIETQKGLAELIENEHATPTSGPSSSNSGHSSSRPRMPPPGFNHIPPSSGHNNGFGPRQPPHFQQAQQQQSSKMLSYMNNQTQANGPNFGNGWNLPNFNFGMFPQQQQQQQMPPQMNDPQMHMGLLGQNQNGGNQHKGFGSISDWTSMDPAILSFRQYPSFSSQQQQQQQPPPPQIPPHLQNTVVAEKFMQHLAQQHQQQQQQQQSVQQQNGQGFGLHGVAPNQQQQSQQQQQQQASQAQVNANVQGMLEYLKSRQLV